MINQPHVNVRRPEPGASASAMCGCRPDTPGPFIHRSEVAMGKLLLLLVGLVLLELTVMIKVGSVIGALPTVGLLVLTAVLGS